jgi:SAM-dependent methyltransferase
VSIAIRGQISKAVRVGLVSWLGSLGAAAQAKAIEELLRIRLLRRYRADAIVAPHVADVLALAPDDVAQGISIADPRSIPSNPAFVASGWSEHMLLRYLLTLEQCTAARVLDSCCGLGWGSHLVGAVAAALVGVDLDAESIRFCARRWGRDHVRFQVGDVLDLPFESGTFDVVLCMDAIEHFAPREGRRYLQELARVCRPGGLLFGSSAFPETRWGADRLRARNPHHLHIYTRADMLELLGTQFGGPCRVTRHYFQATSQARSCAAPKAS